MDYKDIWEKLKKEVGDLYEKNKFSREAYWMGKMDAYEIVKDKIEMLEETYEIVKDKMKMLEEKNER